MAVTRLFLCCCLAFVLLQGQTPKPVSKQALLDTLQIGGLTQTELVQFVRQRGVNFQPSAADEAELRKAGATPQLLSAIRESYRHATRNASTPRIVSSKPLTRSEIVTLLEVGTPTDKIIAVARERGIDFRVTPDVSAQLRKAGADSALLASLERIQPNHAPIAVPPKRMIGRALVAGAPEAPPLPSPGPSLSEPIPTRPRIDSLAELRKLYIEPLPSNFDEMVKAEIARQLPGRVEVVDEQGQADAILRTGGAFSIIDATGLKVLWTDPQKSRNVFGFLRRGNGGKAAEGLVNRFRAELDRP